MQLDRNSMNYPWHTNYEMKDLSAAWFHLDCQCLLSGSDIQCGIFDCPVTNSPCESCALVPSINILEATTHSKMSVILLFVASQS